MLIINRYSRDLNTKHVLYSNGPNLSSCEMVWCLDHSDGPNNVNLVLPHSNIDIQSVKVILNLKKN